MNDTSVIFFICILIGIQSLSAQNLGDPSTLPFTLSMEEVTQDEVPGLHSFAFAKREEWWVIVGGRINGLHGFFISTGFPEDKANVFIRLINPESGEMRQFAVENLSIPYRDALKSTNPQYTQDGQWLYLAGGYGKDQAQSKFLTFPVLTAIDLSVLIPKMVNNEDPSSAFRQVEQPNMRVCGGEMDKIGDYFYLVGGHDFSGLYNQNGPPQFVQNYTNEIRKFKIQHTTSGLTISDYSTHHDDANLHRRDFSLAPVIRPDGSEALCLYGGVFREGSELPFYNPIYIAENDIFEMDAAYNQLFSQYTCPVIPIFDTLDQTMYSIFFGGLSVHTLDGNQLKYDEKVPFIKDITTFKRKADGSNQEFVMPFQFDALLGTNMIYVPAEDAPHYGNEVLKLRSMSGITFVGYLFGGIKADIPNLTPSSANKRMFKVFITPKTSVGFDTPEIVASEQLPLAYPNPFSNNGLPVFTKVSPGAFVKLHNALGQRLYEGRFDQSTMDQILLPLPAGVYIFTAGGMSVKLLKK